MSIIVVGVDPGDSCGLAVIKNGHRMAAQQSDPDTIVHSLGMMLLTWTDEESDIKSIRVACERFITTPDTGKKSPTTFLTPLEIIGMVRNEANRAQVPFHEQETASVKKLASDRLLRRLKLHTTPTEVDKPDAHDVNDAMRHAVFAIAQHHATLFNRMLQAAPR